MWFWSEHYLSYSCIHKSGIKRVFCAFFVSCNDIKMGCNMWLEEKLKPCFFCIPFHMLSHIYFYVTIVICIFLYTLTKTKLIIALSQIFHVY